jgi:hypothetical protein
MKIKHHSKTTEERMMVYYFSLEEKADHHKQMILDGWSIDLSKTKFDSPVFWHKFATTTYAHGGDDE